MKGRKYHLNIKYYIKTHLRFKNFLALFLLIFGTLAIMTLSINITIDSYYIPKIYKDIDAVPKLRVALVLGAGLSNRGTEPSLVLDDRIQTAADLYKQGKVQKVLMSGHGIEIDYDEVSVMLEYGKKYGISEFDLLGDYAGIRTYDSCYRAKAEFGVNELIIITQDFHLPRAMYLCQMLGIEVIGVSADRHLYPGIKDFERREFLATVLAYWEINVSPPQLQPDFAAPEENSLSMDTGT